MSMKSSSTSRRTIRPLLETLEGRITPAFGYALTATNSLLRFDTDFPTVSIPPLALTGIAAGLGPEAGIRAGGIDKRDDGEPELLGELHLSEGLAVALGVGAAEVAGDFLVGGAALLVADDEHAVRADAGETGDHGGVIAEASVAAEFAEVLAHELDVVTGLGALGMAGDADGIDGREIGVDLGEARGAEGAELVEAFDESGAFGA